MLKEMDEKAVYFITADDDFIAANRASEIFEKLSADLVDDMSKEIIDAASSKADDAIKAISNAWSAAQTLSLFGGKKVVWLRGVNFLSDTFRGKSEEFDEALENFSGFLKTLDPAAVGVVISASPIDRRKRFFKAMQSFAECEDFSTAKDPLSGCVKMLNLQAKKLGVKFDENAAETLAGIVAANSRMASSELEKLANYVNCERSITEEDVIAMVPIFGAGDFFDISNAFLSGNLQSSLATLRRFFFANKNGSARPIISTLQKQNSLLIQIRSLLDARKISVGSRGGLDGIAQNYADAYQDLSVKNSYNVFAQNSWYVSNKLAPTAARFTLKKLLDFQLYFVNAFQALIERGGDDEAVMRDLFMRCLSK